MGIRIPDNDRASLSSSSTHRSLSIIISAALIGAILAGIAARLWIYFSQPPLWGDEVMLHMNLLRRSYASLAMPLEYGQLAPVLFLWIQKTAMSVLGLGELAARAVPLFSGVVMVALTAAIVARFASGQTALCAAALASMSPALIQYSNQAKQYIVEAAVTSALVWLCLAVIWKKCSYSGVLLLLAGSCAALLLSIPSAFVVGCAWASYALVCYRRGAPLRFQAAILCGAAASAALFAGMYFLVYSGTGKSAFMQRFWTPLYLSSQESAVDALSLIILTPIRTVFSFDDALPVVVATVALLMCGFGIFRMVSERKWAELILLAGPLCLAIAASAAGKWPIATRLMLFTAPLVLTIVCLGIDVLTRYFRGAGSYAVVCIVLLVFLLPALRYDFYIARHPAVTDNREMVRELVRQAGDDTVYIYSAGPNGALEWLLYSEDWQKPNWKRVDTWLEMAKHLEDSPRIPNWQVGASLIYQSGNRREVIGLDSGSYADATGYKGGPTHPGWAEREGTRILSGCPERVLVFAPHYRKAVLAELFAVLESRGAQLVNKREGLTRAFTFSVSECSEASGQAKASPFIPFVGRD
jgi:hypothetical protein